MRYFLTIAVFLGMAVSAAAGDAILPTDEPFNDAIRNHYATSISTLRGGHALRAELLAWPQQFFKDAAKRAAGLDHRGAMHRQAVRGWREMRANTAD